ncbi:hypothetical protein KP509_33G065800 [Ceratopteris richardii]|uniref:Uncharacterized protein n=1 Tax=Ceratopteris richardii TaxID=49495 RepID=A0A8T2QQL4_CERRI|nr:hypothetical protein KP509_33G065800 [Ceratopteris richardii]
MPYTFHAIYPSIQSLSSACRTVFALPGIIHACQIFLFRYLRTVCELRIYAALVFPFRSLFHIASDRCPLSTPLSDTSIATIRYILVAINTDVLRMCRYVSLSELFPVFVRISVCLWLFL